jgi:hypothetical protein
MLSRKASFEFDGSANLEKIGEVAFYLLNCYTNISDRSCASVACSHPVVTA